MLGDGAAGGLHAQFVSDRGCDTVRMAAHRLFAFRFDHDARQRLCSRITDHDAARVFEIVFGGENCGGDGWDRIERLLLAHSHVDDDLRKDFQVGGQLGYGFAGARNEIENNESGEQAVTRSSEMGKENVARLFAAERRVFFLHHLEDVSVADRVRAACECRCA